MMIENLNNTLDRLILIVEISFIFLVSFTIIALVDAAFEGLNLYRPIADGYLGSPNVGDLRGGNFEEIVRITFVLNGLLFISSLVFGLWIRRTRDGWTWSDFGYTFHTKDQSFMSLVRKGIALGFISILIFYVIMTPLFYLEFGSNGFLSIFAYTVGDRLFTPKELNASYYFGIIEMGFIWPLSAGFFFFSYAHTSLKSRFPVGIANILATIFYVFYLIFFFLIQGREKVTTLFKIIFDWKSIPNFSPFLFWGQVAVFLIILYINFSSFEQTGSIVLPFIMNFVFNVGLTLLRAGNTLAFSELSPLMVIPVSLLALSVLVWLLFVPHDYSTIKKAFSQLKEVHGVSVKNLVLLVSLFLLLSFILPGVIYELLYLNNANNLSVPQWLIPLLFSIDFAILLLSVFLVLSYEPAMVHDVLLITKEGLPLASHLVTFDTDEYLLSGFFTALSSVDKELTGGDEVVSTIKRGNNDILVEENNGLRLIVLADRDHPSLRQQIQQSFQQFLKMHNDIDFSSALASGNGFPPAKEFVDKVNGLQVRFDIPQPIRWSITISMVIGPLMVLLNGLI